LTLSVTRSLLKPTRQATAKPMALSLIAGIKQENVFGSGKLGL
jgi:hypothetical protein